MRIVIVEDEQEVREALADFIHEHTSHKVVGMCENGIEGIQCIQAGRPDLVLTDIHMEGMDGISMLAHLQEIGIKVPCIIITGHSEFESARQAIRLGVKEYLLKPVSAEELKEALGRIEEWYSFGRGLFYQEEYIWIYFFGAGEDRFKAKRMLERILPEERSKAYGIFLGYLGSIKAGEIKSFEYPLRTLRHRFAGLDFLDAREDQSKFRMMILKGSREEIKEFSEEFRALLYHDYQKKKREVPCAFDICDRISDWKDSFLKCRKILSDSLAKGSGSLLQIQDVSRWGVGELAYPIQIEKKIINALVNGSSSEVKEEIDQFLSQVVKQEYHTKEVRYCILMLMGNIAGAIKEINRDAYQKLLEADFMQNAFLAYTTIELRSILFDLCKVICSNRKEEKVDNYTINRALEYIRCHYQEGISLEKMAEVSGITPEYLSVLFKREMGMNFSVFLKRFRISHAKRLLKGTDMKVYEVAKACGFNNSNYFTKVFKEVTGISPTEY